MELGQGKLLRTGLNALYQAIHPIHGLAWTDGTQVVLTNLQLHSGEAKFGDSTVLGQFEHVYGVSWAPPGAADTPTLLAVQHEKCVIVWQLCPSPAEEPSKWLMSQPCEIRQSCPVLPQGCVWHPESAILTVLTARDVSVFYNIHGDSSQVKVDVSNQGLIHCACWTQDGQRLVVAAGSSLHSYIWDSAQKTLHRCSLCPVFDVDSYVRSIGATVASQVAIATELPLDKICGLNASGTFDVPPSGEDTCLRALPVTDPLSSETNSETLVSSSFSEPLDVTHIHFNRFKSEGSSLTCLRKKDYLTGTGLDSSHLVLLTFEKEVTCNRKVIIPGILVPDLIAFNLKAQAVAVASNTSNVIFIYSVIPLLMPNIQQIQLESNERPKGICFLTDKLLLILVGRQKSTDSAFLPSSKSDQYMICLIVREVMLKEDSPVTLSENQSDNSAFSTLINKTSIKKLIEDLLPDFCHQSRGLLFTANSSSQSGRPGRTLIEEIESPASSICDGSTVLETLDARPVNWSVTLPRPSGTPAHTSTAEPPNLEREKETYQLSKELEVVSRNLSEVQRHLSELSNFLHNGKKSSPVYPLSQDLPYVHITCQEDSLPLCHLRSPEYALLLLQLSHVSRVRLCDPIDGSPPGSPVPGILPGKNTGVGCHSLLQCMKVKSESEVAQLYPTLSDPVDCNLPGSSAHGIFQARVLEWVPLPSPEYALGNQKTSCGSLYFSGLEPKSAISEKCHFVRPVVEKRMMLLCNGKLRLSTVQQTFGLSLVEMLHDSHWILLCADSEGFVPLIFTATQEIIIRDGRSDDFQNSASEP